jgi:hypothetical protein
MGFGLARVSIRASRTGVDPEEFLPYMPGGRIDRTKQVCLIKIAASTPDAPLAELLESTTEYLKENHEILKPLKGKAFVDLFIGWSPVAPQASALLPAELITYLAEIGADVIFDMYGELPPIYPSNLDLSCAQQSGRWHRDVSHGVSCCS